MIAREEVERELVQISLGTPSHIWTRAYLLRYILKLLTVHEAAKKIEVHRKDIPKGLIGPITELHKAIRKVEGLG